MTTHPIDTEALAKRAGHILFTDGPEQPAATAREVCVLLDQLAAAEHRATCAEARSADEIRAIAEMTVYSEQALQEAAELMHSVKLAQAEARIQAVRDLHNADGVRWVGFPRADEQVTYCTYCQDRSPCPTIRALEGEA